MSDITDILDRDSIAVLRAFWRRVQPVLRMTGCLNEKELPAKIPVQLTANMRTALCALKFDDIEARLAAAEADAGRHQDVLQKIQSWCEAYPLDVFPEPDWSEVKDKLGAKLLSRVSASNMRHVVLGVKKLCDDALQATAQEGK